MSDDEEKEKIRARVVAILTKYDPTRLNKVDSLLARFEGREDEMFKIMKVGVDLFILESSNVYKSLIVFEGALQKA